MTNTEILDQLHVHGFFLRDGRVNPQSLRNLEKFPELKENIHKLITFASGTDVSFAQIVHALKHELTQIPTCPVCKTSIKFDKASSSYPITCSPKCGAKHSPNKTFKLVNVAENPNIVHKRIATRKHNYRTGHRAKLTDKNWLTQKHKHERYSMVQLASELHVSPQTVKQALQEFNIESPSQQELREATNIRKYGVKNPGLLPEVRDKARASDYANKQGGWKSKGETEIFECVRQLLPTIDVLEHDQHTISPYELDIYIPSKRIAIEYCGLYWHSDKFKKRTYHRDKYLKCKDSNIRLLTIFEDEWKDKQPIVLSKLKSILGVDDTPVIYARKTTIVPLTTHQKQLFFDQYHIQGSGPGSISLGLQYESRIVAAMTFIQRAGGKYELNRYATSTRVIGGFSKLLSEFQTRYNWTEIVSFADLRWSNGNLYNATGWTLDKILQPDYYWCRQGHRWHKFNFRHKFLAERLDVYDPNLSENQNCKLNGYVRIYNCGLLRYVIRQCAG